MTVWDLIVALQKMPMEADVKVFGTGRLERVSYSIVDTFENKGEVYLFDDDEESL
jgi:hypothetical protein